MKTTCFLRISVQLSQYQAGRALSLLYVSFTLRWMWTGPYTAKDKDIVFKLGTHAGGKQLYKIYYVHVKLLKFWILCVGLWLGFILLDFFSEMKMINFGSQIGKTFKKIWFGHLVGRWILHPLAVLFFICVVFNILCSNAPEHLRFWTQRFACYDVSKTPLFLKKGIWLILRTFC